MIERRLECLLLGVAPSSPSSPSIHFRFTGPSGEGRSVIGDNERLEVHPRLVDKWSRARTFQSIFHGIFNFCVGLQVLTLVGEGDGEGEVRGEGKGPTPIVRG